MLTGFFRGTHSADLPRCDFLMAWPWNLDGRRAAEHRLVLELDVTPERVTADAWRSYLEATRAELERRGLWDQVLAVQVGEELYGRIQAPDWDGLLAGRTREGRIDLAHAWLQQTGIPLVRRVFPGRVVTVLEGWWFNQRVPGWFSPVPTSADVLGLDPYAPAWALTGGRALEDVFDEHVGLAVRVAAGYGKPLHLVGQAFSDVRPDQAAWAAFPPPVWLEWTAALAQRTPQVVALSWFAWDTDPAGVQGLSAQSTAHRDAVAA